MTIGALSATQAHGAAARARSVPVGASASKPTPDPHPSATSSAPRAVPEPDPAATSSAPSVLRARARTGPAPMSSGPSVSAENELPTVRSSTPEPRRTRKQEPDSRANHPAKKTQTRTAPPAAHSREDDDVGRRSCGRGGRGVHPVHDHWRWRGWRCSHWFWRAAACCTSCPGSDAGERGPDESAIAASTSSRGPRRSRARQLGDGGPARASGPGLLAGPRRLRRLAYGERHRVLERASPGVTASGCGPTTITSDTGGTPVTCTWSDASGSRATTVNVRARRICPRGDGIGRTRP